MNSKGRPAGTTYIKHATMVRIPYESKEDKDAILEFIRGEQKGLPLGRAIRNILKDYMDSVKG